MYADEQSMQQMIKADAATAAANLFLVFIIGTI
jgi:hypothetical protein